MNELVIKRNTFSISDFLSWQRKGGLVLSPSFQRRQVWRSGAKSYLIDTIIRGLPIPVIILRERKTDLETLEPSREVVDGQQRLRTVFSFVDPHCLSDYSSQKDLFTIRHNHNKDLARKSFKELPVEIQQRILDYEFSTHTLPSRVDDREILQIFARMNSTGTGLNAQELRNSEFFGLFKTLMYELSAEHLFRWRDWNVFSEYDIARMVEVEIVSEFATFALKGFQSRHRSITDQIYKEKNELFPEGDEFRRRFESIMNSWEKGFGSKFKDTVFTENRPLFHVLFCAFYSHQFGYQSDLGKKIRAKDLHLRIFDRFITLSRKIRSGNIPSEIQELIAARQKTKEYIETVHNYFLSIF